jgi:uncharacterized lipoprotein
MLTRLMVFLGGERPAGEGEVPAPAVSTYARQSEVEGEPALILNDRFAPAWRRMGIVLDRVGLLVDEQARADGVYYVTYNPSLKAEERKGFFARLFDFGGGDDLDSGTRFQVLVTDAGEVVQVRVRDAQGAVPDRDDALVVLRRLLAELE